MGGIGKLLGVRKCDNCGKDVEIHHKDRLNRKNIFCCKTCEGEYRKKHNPNYIPCPICGKLFYVKPHLRTGNNCCSHECMGKLREYIYLGENNPNFGNRGSLNPIWKSDERILTYGYKKIRCQNHPFKCYDGFVFEHRLVAEKYLLNDYNSITIDGEKYLSSKFIVHHIDFNKLNNNVTNLCVMPRRLHSSFHKSLYRKIRDKKGHLISNELIVDISDSILMRKMLINFINDNNANNYVSLINYNN